MNKAVIISVLSFWAIVVALLTAGFISSENQRLIESVKGAQNGNQIETGLGVIDNNVSTSGAVDSADGSSGVQIGQGSNTLVVSSVVMDQAYVAKHRAASDCWLIISGKIYNVTEYIPFHPGGQSQIINNCGTDSTALFTSNANGGHDHSSLAKDLLSRYFVASLGTVISQKVAQGEQSTLTQNQENNTSLSIEKKISSAPVFLSGDKVQTTTVLKVRQTPSTTGTLIGSQSVGAKGVVTGSSVFAGGYWWVPVRYDNGVTGWSVEDYLIRQNTADTQITQITQNTQTQQSNEQTQTQNNQNIQQATSSGYTAAVVAQHASASDCWVIINGNVYDLTQYVPFHPGGQSQILQYCGADGSMGFNTRGGTGTHSTSARSQLVNYLLGPLTTETTTTTPPPAADAPMCTSFTYSTWGSCLASGTQTRTVTSSSPAGCTGGTPITTQSCVYTPPQSPDQAYRDTILSQYPGASITKLKVEDNGTAEFKFTYNGTTYEGKMNAQYQITSIQP